MKLFNIQGLRKKKPIPGVDRPLRVFVTGATGYLGSAVVREFARAGHEVTGMTRWAENTLDVKDLGARAVVGDVKSSDTFRRVAAKHDVLIHLASEASADAQVADKGAIEALLWAAKQYEREKEEPPRIVIYTSGVFVLGDTGDTPADETASTDYPAEVVAWRPAHEKRVLDAASEDVATAVIRPGIVYGGGKGLISAFFESAVLEGAARFVGDGTNRWSPVHVGDVARLYRMVAEERAGGIFHCTEERAVPVAELARAASAAAGRGGKVHAVPLEEARATMGPFADALALDQVVVSPRAKELGWAPEHPPFMESAGEVFREWEEARR